MYITSSINDTEPSATSQAKPEPVALFRPVFRKKQDRSKQISPSSATATSETITPGIPPADDTIKKTLKIDFDKELDFEERVIIPLQPSRHPELRKRPLSHEEESIAFFKKSKKDKKDKKKKRRRKHASESEEEEWIEAPPPAKISRPKASDFM